MYHCGLRSIKSLKSTYRFSTTSTSTLINQFDLYNPTEEHGALRHMVREFVEAEVDPQALKYNREEKFNLCLFKKLGHLGLLGITVENEYGGSGMDAVAAVIVHGRIVLFFYNIYIYVYILYI